MLRQSLILTLAIGVLPAHTLASSSSWLETQGGRVRLVTAGAPDAQGVLAGAIEIDLLPGWKTYWRDPGEAGVPPVLDVSGSKNIASAELSFPAPQRFDDGYSKWAGYKHSIALPVKFTLKGPGADGIDANIFLGICETICIPVQGRLQVDPADDPGDAADAALVKAAFAALPKPDEPGFGVKLLDSDAGHVEVEAHAPHGTEPLDFFLASEQGYVFGTPERKEVDGKVRFSVPLLDRPETTPTQGALSYTLTTNAGSVTGALPFP